MQHSIELLKQFQENDIALRILSQRTEKGYPEIQFYLQTVPPYEQRSVREPSNKICQKLKNPNSANCRQKYNFVLNPYPSERLSRYPYCGEKTGQRKRPLLIHVDPRHLIALNYTCRYCQQCDLLIAHKDEIEHLLFSLFNQYDPKAIGNEYLVIGTVEKKCWLEGLEQPKDISEMLP
jgi:hypothetical protein